LIYQTLRQLASVCEERSGVASGLRADEVLPAAVPARRDRDVYFFGPYQSSLLGVFHPAGSARIDREVLVCQPIGQEYMRSHRACTQLSCRLARRGMPVLRFDYFGTGDSAGSHTEVRLDRWVDDVESAATHLAARVEASRLCLIGLRWGGTLATLFAARQGAVDQLVLWNPAVDGSAYCRELDAMHRDMLRRSYVRRPQQTSDAMEILGYPFPGKLLEDFESVNLMKVDRAPAPRVLLIDSAGDDSLSLFGAHLRRLGADVVERQYKGPMLWLEEPFKEVVPTDIWDEIEQQLAGSAS
jgi:pimeloyl-ACP methyl ester carboxylesterase